MDLRTITGPEAANYRLDRQVYTHGRCPLCRIVVAWRASPGRRLKDHPRCPACDGLLLRTCALLIKGPLRVRVQAPRFGLGFRIGKLADVHAEASGELCTDDGRGACRVCGVSLANPCATCGALGYHRADCAEVAP